MAMRRYPRRRFCIGWADFAAGVAYGLVSFGRSGATAIERAAARPALATYSVRTALDLYLQVRAFPRGSEIICSALNIPDMFTVIAHHGLLPVPVDLDPATLAVERDDLERARSPRTRAVIFAHLFGARADVAPVIEFAEHHQLDLIEDCAQAYVGPEFTGDPRSTLALFSFGTIKTGTAFGGAVAYAREAELLAKMRVIQEKYPVQPRGWFLTRVLKYAGLQVFSYPTTFTLLCAAARWAGIDFDRALHRALRGFRGDNLIGNIRHQASAPLLKLLERRLRTFDTRQIMRRRERAHQLIAGLAPDTRVAGDQCANHSYWVFPLIARAPGRLIEALRAAGFDATQTATLSVLAPAERIARAHPAIVYLPCYAEVPTKAIARLAAIVRTLEDDAAQRNASAVFEPLRL